MTTTLQERPPAARAGGPEPDVLLGRSPAEPRARRVAVVAASTVTMLVVGFWGLDRGSMWQDEAATYTVATRPVHQILAVLQHIDLVHGAYYLFEHLWLGVLGPGEVWMRVPSVLGMGVAAGATAALGARLAGARTGLLAGVLFAGWPLVSYYAQEGRSYALVTGAVLVGTWCLVRALEGGPRRWWWGYAVSVVVAATLHELAVLAVVAHAVVVLLARPPWRVWRWWLVSASACAVLVSPVALLSLDQSNQVSYLTSPTPATLVDLGEKFLGSSVWSAATVLVLVALGAAAEVRRWRRHQGGGLGAVALPLLLVPVVLLLLVSLVHPLFGVRYVLFCVAGVPLLAARGIEVVAARVAGRTRRVAAGRVVAAVLLVAVLLAQLPDLRRERTVQSRSEDFAGAAAVVGAQARPGDAVVFVPLSFRLAAMAYPAGFSQVDDVLLDRSAVDAGNLRGTAVKPAATRAAMLQEQRIWVVGSRGLRVKSSDKTGSAVMDELRRDFREEQRHRVHGVDVVLFVRRDR